jgi:hypothetical protein
MWRYVKLKPLTILDLDGDGGPEVIATLIAGGAHGGVYSFICARSDSRRKYSKTPFWWESFPTVFRDLDGDSVLEFRTADSRFQYTFTDYADSAEPIRIWNFSGGRLSVVTTNFLPLVENDRAAWWRSYLKNRSRGDVRGVLAAYMADMYMLGEQQKGWQQLRAALERGDLDLNGRNSYPGPGPYGQAYLNKLRRFLVRTGYAG